MPNVEVPLTRLSLLVEILGMLGKRLCVNRKMHVPSDQNEFCGILQDRFTGRFGRVVSHCTGMVVVSRCRVFQRILGVIVSHTGKDAGRVRYDHLIHNLRSTGFKSI